MEYTILEQEITKYWDVVTYDKPLITIRCTTYNHENYIASAIEGFLSQKTRFPFKIYIHDDCSSDRTAEIIRSYEIKYPNIIEVTYETENQWSKKDGSLARIIREHIKTKYVAMCEGDDYWIDEEKLEKQVAVLEKNEQCSISITNGKILDVERGEFFPILQGEQETLFGSENREITLSDCMSIRFPPTASYVYRFDYSHGLDIVPRCFNGDLRLRLYLMTRGNCYYIKDETVVYRKNVPNSAMTKSRKKSRKALFDQEKKTCEMIEAINQISGFSASDELWRMKEKHLISMISNCRDIRILLQPESKKAYLECNLKTRIKLIVKMMTPDWLYEMIRK